MTPINAPIKEVLPPLCPGSIGLL